ncbi:MAG: DUF2214 family protein [Betaproteobacteria bacterium]|nr:DUF2214 family protein [Betaproteobacteria bacterium]
MTAFVAYVHVMAILAFAMLLSAEFFLCNEHLQPGHVLLLGHVDLAFLCAAATVLVSGGASVLVVGRSPWHYLSSPLFWAKFATFFVLLVVSIYPTLRFVAWRRGLVAGRDRITSGREIRRVRRVIAVELALLALIPLFSSMLARDVVPGS